jgi:hypothetical protein
MGFFLCPASVEWRESNAARIHAPSVGVDEGNSEEREAVGIIRGFAGFEITELGR